MAPSGWQTVAEPLFFHCNTNFLEASRNSNGSKTLEELRVAMMGDSCGWTEHMLLMLELRKKILTFRDVLDLPPCDASGTIHELAMGTREDLHKLYPDVGPCNLSTEMEETSINQALAQFYNALKSIRKSWAKNHKWMVNTGDDREDSLENESLEELGQKVLAKLNFMINVAREMFDVMDEDENSEGRIQSSTIGDILTESYSNKRITPSSPTTTISVPPEFTISIKCSEFENTSYSSPLLLPLRLQALEQLRPNVLTNFTISMSPFPIAQGCSPTKSVSKTVVESKVEIQDVKEESTTKESCEGTKDSKATDSLPTITNFDSNGMAKDSGSAVVPPPPPPPPPSPTVTPPPSNLHSVVPAAPPLPPPISPSKGSVPMAPPPMPMAKGAMPPAPPPIGMAKALRPKKASTKLKRSTHMGNLYRLLKGKVEGSNSSGETRKNTGIGGSAGGKQGMADALAEMTKRSAYFQKIEADVQEHAKWILEMKATITSFQTKDMAELLKFHKHVEQHLEQLSDETQVLARFEGFPVKKLESLRTASALYSKLEEIATNLKNWKVESPLAQLLDKVEAYFNKIKKEVDALERSKDEESKRFQSHKIHFDYSILVRIKEYMVDVSSSCMELALKERRQAKAEINAESGEKTQGQTKTSPKMLWRAFQLAFRIYSFAGGHDDRADSLSKDLAHEIETDPQASEAT